jgi:glycosyl transferase family 25
MENRSAASLKIYVISLVSQKRRREEIRCQLNKFDIEWDFFDAIDFQKNEEAIDYFFLGYENIAPRALSRGEIACSASHNLLYRRIVQDNVDYAVVLEDDAILGGEVEDFLRAVVDGKITSFDVAILGYSKLSVRDSARFYAFEPISKLGSFKNISYGIPWKNWTCGTVAYVVSRQGSKKLSNSRFLTLADDWVAYERKLDLNIIHTRPLLIFENFENLESSLQRDRGSLLRKERKHLDLLRICRGYIRKFLISTKLGVSMLRFIRGDRQNCNKFL